MKASVYTLEGKEKKKIELPKAFNEEFRPDLIRRAVKAIQANRRQPYGASPNAGKRHVTEWGGKGRGISRVQRIKDSMRGAFSPGTVGGRRAHPPKVEKVWKEKINDKERRKAIKSALAMTADKEKVKERGHKFDDELTLPIIVEDSFEDLETTKKVIEFFEKVKIYEDIIRAKEGKHIRAGRGRNRGRKYRIPKSILIVASKRGRIEKGADNLVGVDVVTVDRLNAEHLAPGGDAGRLAVFTESAIKSMEGW